MRRMIGSVQVRRDVLDPCQARLIDSTKIASQSFALHNPPSKSSGRCGLPLTLTMLRARGLMIWRPELNAESNGEATIDALVCAMADWFLLQVSVDGGFRVRRRSRYCG
jgi:hypothetical protein